MKLILSTSASQNVIKYAKHVVDANGLADKFPDLNIAVFLSPALTTTDIIGAGVYDPVSDKIVWSKVEGDPSASIITKGWNTYMCVRGGKQSAVTLAYNAPMETE